MWRPETTDKSSDLGTRPSLIKEHYEGIRKRLRDEGYGDLTRMADRLQTRISKFEDKLESLESRVLYLQAQREAFYNRYNEIESSLEENDSQGNGPIGRNLSAAKHRKHFKDDAWKIDRGNNSNSEQALSNIRISYRPSHEEVNSDLSVFTTEFDPADLYSFDTLVFNGDQTWKEVFDQFENRLGSLRERKNKILRTRDLLEFRLGIVEMVLYQVEAFGSVGELTEAEAEAIASQSEPGRPTRLERPEYVFEVLSAVCEWLDSNPPPHFRTTSNDEGLANFVAEEIDFELASVEGAKSFLMEIFPQLEKAYPDLPVPELESKTDGRAYVDKADEIRRLRDEYEREVVLKKDG